LGARLTQKSTNWVFCAMEFKRRTFRYKYNTELRACYSIFLVIFGVFLGAIAAYRGERLFGFEFATIWCLLFVPLMTNAVLLSSSVVVSSEYIGWILFGHIWKTTAWDRVKGIRIITMRQFPTKRTVNMYCIDVSAPPKFYLFKGGSIYFKETIEDFEILKKYIDTAVRQFEIPIRNLNSRNDSNHDYRSR
jgi:hypothetical protein